MRNWIMGLATVLFAASFARAGAFKGNIIGPALNELTKADAAVQSGSAEDVSKGGAKWSDGAKTRESLTIEGRQDSAASKEKIEISKPASGLSGKSGVKVPNPTPAPSGEGAGVGFMAGFMGVMAVPIALMMVPIVGWLVGGVAAAVLFIPALIVGGIGALIGSFF